MLSPSSFVARHWPAFISNSGPAAALAAALLVLARVVSADPAVCAVAGTEISTAPIRASASVVLIVSLLLQKLPSAQIGKQPHPRDRSHSRAQIRSSGCGPIRMVLAAGLPHGHNRRRR